MSQAGARKGSSERQFNLGWALAISIVLHVVLALLSGWIPMISSTPIAEPPEESVLQFTFNQPTEDLVEEDSPPRGDVPFDTPQPQPQPSVEPTPPPVEPGFEAQPQVVPAEQLPPMPEPAEPREAVEPATENPIENDQEEVTESVDPEAAEFPEQLEGPIVKDPGEESAPDSATRPDRQRDLDQMMQDFGRQLDHARAAEPPRPAGDGPPRNVFVPDPSEVATTGYGLGNLTFETADFDWSDYARSIYIEIWRAWHNRLLRLVNEFEKWSHQNREPLLQHRNQILFVIEHNGRGQPES